MPGRQRPRAGSGGRWRAIDLATTAGVSVQQVRNYVELGVLPPVERTPSGYRIFTAAHADALAVARRLAEGHGRHRASVIMRAVHGGDLDTALATLDASHAELDRARSDLATALDDARADGSPERAHAELVLRERELRRRSLSRLGASAALYAYLQRREPAGG